MVSNSTHDVSSCSGCGAPIRWTVTATRKRQAVNPEPDPKGNLAVYADGTGRLRSRGLTKERPALEHLEWQAMPHQATCPRPAPRRTAQPRQRTGVRATRWQGWQR
ncbi:hypothetical protein ACFVDH_22050 [Streptomyces sp. NPDC057674]|uniref:hypothetical protein n=1 Tax=Streptomyces sp. NPDC057674 TaxID=3346203 RepID=UPI0036C0A54E